MIFKGFLPEYEFSETPHRTATPSKTQIDTRLHVCITPTGIKQFLVAEAHDSKRARWNFSRMCLHFLYTSPTKASFPLLIGQLATMSRRCVHVHSDKNEFGCLIDWRWEVKAAKDTDDKKCYQN